MSVVPGRRFSVSVYKVIEIIGTSGKSWEDAAASAVKKAGETLAVGIGRLIGFGRLVDLDERVGLVRGPPASGLESSEPDRG